MSAYVPVRVQRKRTNGWTAPACGCGCLSTARYVGRGTRWGNPWKVGSQLDTAVWSDDADLDAWVTKGGLRQFEVTAELAVALFRAALLELGSLWDLKHSLSGHDLMCWCPLDQPCHADVLLELANGAARS